MDKIYVASSWRNADQPALVTLLRNNGFKVYDFRNPSPQHHGFSWSEIDPNWKDWSPEEYINALDHARSIEGYNLDHDGIMWADVCLLLLPSGRSAHVEAGYMKGLGKKVFVILNGNHEAELMYKVFDGIFPTTIEAVTRLIIERGMPGVYQVTGEKTDVIVECINCHYGHMVSERVEQKEGIFIHSGCPNCGHRVYTEEIDTPFSNAFIHAPSLKVLENQIKEVSNG